MRSGEALIARAGVVATGLALALTAPAAAATIEVETDADEFGQGGACTLREAVEAAGTNAAFGGCPKGSKKADKIVVPADVILTIPETAQKNAGGDLDYGSRGKLTITGGDSFSFSMPSVASAAALNTRALEVTRGKVTVKGLALGGFDNSEDEGGAFRVAGPKASLKVAEAELVGNSAELDGGAIACVECKRLDLRGLFRIDDNFVDATNFTQGGAIWSSGPVVIKGSPSTNPVLGRARLNSNSALTTGGSGQGGAIYATDDLTIKNAQLNQNTTEGGRGGAIAVTQPTGGAKIALEDVTLDGNVAGFRAGALDSSGALGTLSLTRVAVTDNSGVGFGGGIFTQSDVVIDESIFDSNSLGPQNQGVAQGGGFYANSGGLEVAQTVEITRSSFTNNSLTGDTQQGAGIFTSGIDLQLTNSTVSSNSAPTAGGGDGGGVFSQEGSTNGVFRGSLDVAFTTFRDNVAGTGTNDGDAIYASHANTLATVRASIVDESTDGCHIGGATDIVSGGYNVEDVVDPDCGMDAPTDSHDSDFLNPLQANGSPPIGAPFDALFNLGRIPLTHAFTNDSSGALDIVPPVECVVEDEPVTIDARGVPRPQGDGCDAGAIERVACNQAFVVGPSSFVGRQSADEIQGGYGDEDVVLAQGGDDFISTYSGDDAICAGKGNDEISPRDGADSVDGGPGVDLLSYNNSPGGVDIDLSAGTVTGASGIDSLAKIENVQGTEGDDEIAGSDGANLLIGGGGVDGISGGGGIDVIDARDGEADDSIDCGPGKNSKEKAKIDPGLDPAPVSC